MDQDSDVWPVYRTSPYRAEAARQAQASTTTRILFVDEGHQCRSVLAQAIFEDLLKCYGRHLDVRVESASVGPAPPGEHDRRVVAAARQARVSLRPRLPRVFDEVVDIVNFDLVVVLDHFDLTEVVKEVAVLDNINPGGLYAARVKLLGRYAPKAASFAGPPSLGAEDIPDPLYGNAGGPAELVRLRTTVQQIRAACRGLLRHLLDLDKRCRGGLPLSKALLQALQCPLLSASASCAVAPRLHRTRAQRPVWREAVGAARAGDADAAAAFYTIRVINGKQRVVRRPGAPAKPGYWKDRKNVEAELRKFMATHGISGRMPSCTELREAGAFTLYSAISKHGGVGAFARQLGLDPKRRDSGYWEDFENLKQELMSVVSGDPASQSEHDSLQDAASLAANAGEEGTLPQNALDDDGPRESDRKGEPDEAAAQLPGMPTIQDLQRSGHNSLIKAINHWGGRSAVARRLGLACSPTRRLMTLGDLSLELEKAVPFVLQFGVMPSRTQLLEAGRPDLLQAVKRMGGFKRVAAALELAFLPARRGRSAAGAWSPGDVQSPLALVQFGSSQHPVSISEAPLPVPPGSPLPGCQDRNASGDGDAAAGPERERRAARLEAEREVRAAMMQATPRRNVALGIGSRWNEGGRGASATSVSPIPTGRPPSTIGMRTGSGAAGLGLLRKQEEQDSEGAMVAPLLQEVAAEVQHFVATSGFSRMPTRLELKVAGTNPHSSPGAQIW
ncbi:hypothetical protein COCSUDRAFT_48336 [Coccomyxa subellipsoidea C-169]|uniref:protein-tyrosine-phosphatase n=1 Tax=Coccomyxa subellipsoidea (strain C-169) TaxID=574566 RepID=I0YSB5_COCSC|nr:hypothetical protein COCSUDRAFT_48336 [Coccomyxa subellipsoidea C-169]EIE21284.1 hypothetical protein COCSUDRAFT_48336 [Coccomyxa subellipsoidea C-169]|eukprot:XP_005645828.1 hypothetical protein COCSUDRAFT_48336 [Coccomyxa subellipsoidea C-169]